MYIRRSPLNLLTKHWFFFWHTDSLSQNGGTNCPACRGPSTVVTPFRALQSIVDALLRAAPHKGRAERERQQADEIYKVGHSIRVRTHAFNTCIT